MSAMASPTGRREKVLEVISKEVKPPKKRITREDIEREDDDMINTIIDKMTGLPGYSKFFFNSSASQGNISYGSPDQEKQSAFKQLRGQSRGK